MSENTTSHYDKCLHAIQQEKMRELRGDNMEDEAWEYGSPQKRGLR